MKTKTEKTPLMNAAAFGPTSCPSGLVLKSKLLHSPEVQSGFVPKLSLHGGKNLALRAKKPIIAMRRGHFYSKEPRNQGNNIPKFPDSLDNKITRSFFSEAVFLPLMMSYVAKQCVVMSWLVRELAPRHKARTAAQKLEELRHRQRGF